MHVLITGHLGYIGPIMVKMFKEAGHQVTGFDVGYFKECLAHGGREIVPDHSIAADIRDLTSDALSGIEAIVHLAGLSNDPLGQLNPKLTHDINYISSIRLAKLAKQSGISRFVFASSCSIYGAAGDSDEPLTEEAPFNPVSAYAVSKVKTEADLSQLADESFSPVYLRNATAHGVSPRMRLDLVLNNLMGWAKTTGTIRVISDGTPWRPLVHIEDISRAALAAVQGSREAVHNQAFNIGRNDCNYQVKDIAEAVAQTIPSAKLFITGETGGDPRSYRVSFSKAEHQLPGFNPQWTLTKACQELDQWFSAGLLDDQTFQSRMFIRLKQLQHLLEIRALDEDLRWIM